MTRLASDAASAASSPAASLSALLRPVAFSDLPGWDDDPMLPAFEAFRRSASHMARQPYRTGSLGPPSSSFACACSAALAATVCDDRSARAFFERWFRPCRIEPENAEPGLVTGFYEPEAAASVERTETFTAPLYAPPDDLVEIDEDTRPAGLDPYLRFARRTQSGLVEYHDRAAIEQGVLEGRARVLAWLADPVDAFFIHVQGAARLAMTDGSVMRVTYAAKSGQRFTGPGHVLAEMGEIPRKDVTMQSIRAWFARNPGRIHEILWQNRSYIFFRETSPGDPAKGPIAAAKVQLEPGRSLAVDRLLHTFGTPFFIDAPSLTAFGGSPFRRLMVAQDTGSAIIGPARGDIFAGTGPESGEIAGKIRHFGRFYPLFPREWGAFSA